MNDNEILEIVNTFCNDLVIHQKLVTSDYRWFWEYKGKKSDELHLVGLHSMDFAKAGFASPSEALAHFTVI